MRMPSHLRKFSQGYNLEHWVDGPCPLEQFFKELHPLAGQLDQRVFVEPSAPEAILVNLVAHILDAEGSLEDYVFGVHPPLTFHDLSEEGAMAPVCEAVAILVVRRYRAAITKGTWFPPAADEARP
jgi:hypothetical protein